MILSFYSVICIVLFYKSSLFNPLFFTSFSRKAILDCRFMNHKNYNFDLSKTSVYEHHISVYNIILLLLLIYKQNRIAIV